MISAAFVLLRRAGVRLSARVPQEAPSAKRARDETAAAPLQPPAAGAGAPPPPPPRQLLPAGSIAPPRFAAELLAETETSAHALVATNEVSLEHIQLLTRAGLLAVTVADAAVLTQRAIVAVLGAEAADSVARALMVHAAGVRSRIVQAAASARLEQPATSRAESTRTGAVRDIASEIRTTSDAVPFLRHVHRGSA